MSDDDLSYKVGYRKPPREHQFKKGQTGNPRGRPKKDFQDAMEIYKELLGTYYEIRVNGKLVKKTAFEIMMMQHVQKAMGGDYKSTKEIINLNKNIFLEREILKSHKKLFKILSEEEN